MINPTPPTHPPRHLKQLSLAGGPRPLHLTSPSTSQFGLQSASPTSPLVRSNSGNSNTPSKRPNAPKRLSSISYSTSTRNVLATPMVSPGLRSAPLRLPEGVENAPGSESSSPRLSRAEGPDFPPTVLTLAERHSDLLQFIAQKESKCLELRTQLEQHEAELRVLKVKWEKIVSKSKPKASASRGVGDSASTPVGVGGEVVGALKEVGRFFGFEDTAVPASPLSSSSSSSSLPVFPGSPAQSQLNNTGASPAPLDPSLPLTPSKTPESASSSSVSKSTTEAFLLNKRPRHRTSISRSSSASSVLSSPTTSPSSGRDSLSSVSTALSSIDIDTTGFKHGDITPTRSNSSHCASDGKARDGSNEAETSHADHTGTYTWVPGPLNQKWNQIQNTPTFSRNSHRASLLLSDVSDVSSSILSSLTSVLLPPLPSESDRKKSPQQQPQLKPPSQLNPASLQPSPQPSVSLLDADEEEQTFTTPVMSLRVASTGPRASLSSGSKSKPADTDDEWNW